MTQANKILNNPSNKTAPKYLDRFTDMRALLHYDVFLIDIWGVVHNGLTPYPGVVECLNHLISLNKTLFFLSNAPRPGAVIIQKLLDFGIKARLEMMLTSGDVARSQLINYSDPFYNHPSKQVFHLGAHSNEDILAGIPMLLVDNLKTADVLLLSAFMDEGENLEQYDAILQEAADRKIPSICVNPDTILKTGDKIRYCPGVLAEKFEHMGGVVHYYGKPHLPIYESVFSKLQLQGIPDKSKILMIGDTLETDILGAHRAGIDSALVLTGNMQSLLESTKESISKPLENTKETISQPLEQNMHTIAMSLETLFDQKQSSPTWIIGACNLS